MISRRGFLSLALALAGEALLPGPKFGRCASPPQFFFAQIIYRGGEWDPNPQFVEPMVEELELRTSIKALPERRTAGLDDPELFFFPFLYLAGRFEFDPFTAKERETLRRFLNHGGFLFAEDTAGTKGFGFDRSFHRELREIFPRTPLRRLPPDHSVYRSFYLLDNVAGRQKVNPFLEGVTLENWTPVIYSQNDLSGAWSKDRSGRWVHECRPGGETQRSAAFKAGINIIVYSLTSDYKKDLVHHPFIQRRQNR